jgi:hypothetical protein
VPQTHRPNAFREVDRCPFRNAEFRGQIGDNVAPVSARLLQCRCNERRSNGEAAPADAGTIVPDGAVELVLSFADPMRRFAANGPCGSPLGHTVVGQMNRATRVDYTGAVDLLGIRFRPAGAYCFLGTPLHELTGQIVPLDAVATRIVRAVGSQSASGSSNAGSCAWLECGLSYSAGYCGFDGYGSGALTDSCQRPK